MTFYQMGHSVLRWTVLEWCQCSRVVSNGDLSSAIFCQECRMSHTRDHAVRGEDLAASPGALSQRKVICLLADKGGGAGGLRNSEVVASANIMGFGALYREKKKEVILDPLLRHKSTFLFGKHTNIASWLSCLYSMSVVCV